MQKMPRLGEHDAEPQEFLPPPNPPPLLTADEIRHLAYQGWLPISLPGEVASMTEEIFRESDSFFAQSFLAKRELYPPSRGTEFGYYCISGEKEYVTFRRQVHPDLPLEQISRDFWQYASSLLHRILVDVARAGEYPLALWTHMLEGTANLREAHTDLDGNISLLRIFRYEPDAGVADAHVDIGLLTLCVGRGAGLQVLDMTTKTYVDAPGPIVLVGDYARALLRNRVRAGWHRVVSNSAGRGSLVFALRPCLRHETDLGMFGHPAGGIVSTDEHFWKVKGMKISVNIAKDQQETVRARSRTSRSSASTLAVEQAN